MIFIKFLKYFLFLLLFLSCPNVWAKDPDIKLEYDPKGHVLHIDIHHISDKLPKHRIRKVVVYDNDKEIQTFYYPTQKPTGLTQDVDISAKPADILKVDAYCTESGSKEELLTVPAEENAESKSEAVAPVP